MTEPPKLSPRERLNSIAEKLSPLLDRKRQLEEEVNMLVPLRRNRTGDAKFDEIQSELEPLNVQVNLLRQEQISILLESLGEISERLDSDIHALSELSQSQLETSKNLLMSSSQQVDVTTKLEKSSRRLDLLTSALLLMTALLLYFAAAPYLYSVLKDEGTSPATAALYANAVSLLILAMVFTPLTIMAYRRGKSTGDNKEKDRNH